MNCIVCGSPIKRNATTYCSHTCQQIYQYKAYIEQWKLGVTSGMRGIKTYALSVHVERYIKDKYNNQCAKCGWHETNTYTNTTPLEIDHIDGNSLNNSEDNLILLCPNCHSLTATYKGANKGNGRSYRKPA